MINDETLSNINTKINLGQQFFIAPPVPHLTGRLSQRSYQIREGVLESSSLIWAFADTSKQAEEILTAIGRRQESLAMETRHGHQG